MSYPSPRTYHPSVWCFEFMRCHGIDVPGYKGGGAVELCEACEQIRLRLAERLARAGEPAATQAPVPEDRP